MVNRFSRSKKKPNGFWDSKENVNKFLNNVKINYKLDSPEDWNKISSQQIKDIGGSYLLNKYSLLKLKQIACPEFNFENKRKPKGFWEDKKNIINFINKAIDIFKLDNIEKITKNHIFSIGGGHIFKYYTLYQIKCIISPNLLLKEEYKWKRKKKSKGFWENNYNVDQFIENLSIQHNLKTWEDWNLITSKDIIDFGGGSLLKKFSLFQLKSKGCPELINYNFSDNNFKPKGFWDKQQNVREFLDRVKIIYQIDNVNDWSRISKNQIKLLGGASLLTKYSLYEMLSFAYPEVDWNEKTFSNRDKRSAQRWLFIQVKKLFPGEEIIEDYFHADLSRISGWPIQFDVFLSDKKIAFEYHGKQHYEDIPSGFAPLYFYQQRDFEKQKVCEENNITLVIVPYWWDNEIDSLKTFIKQ